MVVSSLEPYFSIVSNPKQMLPFGGQGSNQAIEDGGALGYLLNNVDDTAKIEQRLKTFETIRKDRASRVQILSSVRAGKEKEVEQQLRKYADGMGSGEFDAMCPSLASLTKSHSTNLLP